MQTFLVYIICLLLCGVNNAANVQGDILFLHMSKDPIRAGEIVVFNVDVSFLLGCFFTFFLAYLYLSESIYKWDYLLTRIFCI